MFILRQLAPKSFFSGKLTSKFQAYARHLSSTSSRFAVAEEDDDDDFTPKPVERGELPKIRERKLDEYGRAYGTGRRKTSVARVWIKEGCGQIVVNDKNFIDYFSRSPRGHVLGVFQLSKTSGFFDVWCTVKGGGPMGK